MIEKILPYIFYSLGSVFFLIGSLISIMRMLK